MCLQWMIYAPKLVSLVNKASSDTCLSFELHMYVVLEAIMNIRSITVHIELEWMSSAVVQALVPARLMLKPHLCSSFL